MKHTTYFQIDASAEALKWFPSVLSADEAEILLEPVLTSRSWSDRSAWRQKSVVVAVKLLYLARIREYVFLAAPADARYILGSDAISIEVFDRWWSLREMPWEEPSENWEVHLAVVAEQVGPTGDHAVDDMLRALSTRETEKLQRNESS